MWHDLTHPIRSGIVGYPGDPPVRIEPWADAAPWQVSAVCLGSHTGTHMDAPRHVDPAGSTLSDIAADRFIGRGIILDATGAGEDTPLTTDLLTNRGRTITTGGMVLLRTGWDRYWQDGRYLRHPFLSPELATALAALGVALVGTDALSVDSSVAGGSAAHRALLGAGVLIVENLRGLTPLDPAFVYDCVFAPLALDQADGAPVRALVRVADESKATRAL